MHHLLRTVSRWLAWLVLPLALLLLAQWPLRDLVQAYSRQTNDVAQILFALLASVSIAAASQAGTHLSAQTVGNSATAGWRRWALLLCVVPWALFMLWASAGGVWQSFTGGEKFAETLTPGFFLVKLAMVLLYVLVVVQAVAAAVRTEGDPA
jgi:TRAP-type mannitol/chloroaromatic compound transport system permease small subunit